MPHYEDCMIQLGPNTPEGVHVRISCALGGDGAGTLAFSIDPRRIRAAFPQAIRAGVGRNVQPATASDASELGVEELGHSLFNAVFRDRVRSVLDRSLGKLAGRDHSGLRIKLRVDLQDTMQANLHNLPWELLFQTETAAFLGLSRRSPIVRYLDLPQEIRSRPLPDLMRILAVAPRGRDLPPLNQDAERRVLEALERRVQGIRVEFLEPADLDTLRSVLLDRRVHVLHFMGHGEYVPTTDTSLLYLDGPQGRSRSVTARELIETIHDFPDLRLIVLNACETARAGGGNANPYSSLAPALMRAGLPAVLAMQLPISDAAAIAFSESFYRRLSAGDPIDAAVTEGRLAVARRDRDSAEWAVPALFMRLPDGALFQDGAPAGHASGADLGRVEPRQRPQPTWWAHLEVGNYESACQELQRELAVDPQAHLVSVALAIGLSRGSHLRRLRYATAVEMRRLLVSALSREEDRGVAAACLIPLKLEYFQANSVKDTSPGLEELAQIAVSSPIPDDAWKLPGALRMSRRTREILSRIETTQRRKR